MLGEKVVGETPSVEPKQLIGRTLEVNLIEFIQDYSKFYIKLKLQIERVEGQKAYTKLIGHDTMTERVYRMVQRHGRRVDVVQDLMTKDNIKIRIKTVFVLLKRVGTSMKDATRKVAWEKVDEMVRSVTFEELMNGIVSGELASEIRKSCNKVYPIAGIEIRKTEVFPEKRRVEA